jgi:hypothetical protein
MPEITRTVALHGDLTTQGGVVIAPGDNNTVMDRQIALAGDKVECPACNTTGFIRSVPPTPDQSHHGRQFSGEKPIYVYAVTTPSQVLLSKPFIGMALVNVDRPVSARGTSMRGYSNSRIVEVSQCFGTEGLNLNVMGATSTVAPVYYSVGYEIDLTAIADNMRCK